MPLRSERTLRVEEFPTIAPLMPDVEDVIGAMVLGIENGSASERLMLDALQILVVDSISLVTGCLLTSKPVGRSALMLPADINST
jgi:hypothetical protein